MAIENYFASSYSEAREKLVPTGKVKGASHYSYKLDHLLGPGNESLSTDVLTIGPTDAVNIIVIISGTHGVEGLAGAGCQVGFFEDEIYQAFSSNTLAILIHALNPYGFAWRRRVNEDNIDINRNFQDFSKPLPLALEYEEMHDYLIPESWEGDGRQRADIGLQNFIKARGLQSFQAALQQGQYSRPNGLFYGGNRDTWSNKTLHQILNDHVPPTAKRIVSIDIHTGLGPTGYGEIIYVGNSKSVFERARQWFGPEVTSPMLGNGVSAKVLGTTEEAYKSLSSPIEVTPLSLEFGTVPIMRVLEALRGDHWLYAKGITKGDLYDMLKRDILDAFIINQKFWKSAVYGRTIDIILRAARKITEP